MKRANGTPEGIDVHNYPGGRVRVIAMTLEQVISEAFHMPPPLISGGPGWIRSDGDRYDIEAKPPAGSPASQLRPAQRWVPLNGDQRLMLQSLLADRFQLKFHRENKQGPVYYLVKDKTGPKLTPPKDPGQRPWAGSGNGGPIIGYGIAGANITMTELAYRLTGFLGRTVIDRTGLTGSYDFKFEDVEEYGAGPTMVGMGSVPPAKRETVSDDPAARLIHSTFRAIKGIGLRLDQGTGPVETIVIDSIERPSEN